MIIISCGNSETLAKAVAQKLKVPYSNLTISSFPDGDTYLKFNTEVKKKIVVVVQSFQPYPEKSLYNLIFAAETAKDLGAKKVILVAPYLAFMRQDARFHPGEAISSKIMGKHLSLCIDQIITFDAHIHRYKSLGEVFSIPAKNATTKELIAAYIKKHFNQVVIVGPDGESYQWAEHIAKQLGVKVTVCHKERISAREVKVTVVKPVVVRGKNVIIVDDIISTGHTVIEAARALKKLGAKSISVIAVHGLLVEKAIAKMKKAGIKNIITTNCIEHPTNKIDVTTLIVEELKKE